MASVLNGNFVRSVTKRVHDCANPIQLREYLGRYRSYVFTKDIQEVFLDRIDFFKENFSGDSLQLDIVEEIEDTLNTEIKIANITKSGNHLLSENEWENPSKLVRAINNDINLLWIQDDCSHKCPKELKLLKQVFKMTNGNKVDICRVLDIDNGFLNEKIEQYKLKDELNTIRRDYRNSCKK